MHLVPGTIDCFKVSCFNCDRVDPFHPPHNQTHRARVQARVLGWAFFLKFGWVCPKCYNRKPRGRDGPTRVQATLPGFGILSKNQGRRFP